MTRLFPLVLLALAAGCADDEAPAWALDTIYLEPTGDGIYGLHAWELFGERWARRFKGRHQVCSVVVELDGTPTDASSCEGAEHAWRVETTLVDTECDAPWDEDERFLSLRAVAIGTLADELVDHEDDPHPGTTSGAWADYGGGWEPFGWAYPEALDLGDEVETTTWDGTQPFTLWPAWVWDLEP